jgi:hypothetical protein
MGPRSFRIVTAGSSSSITGSRFRAGPVTSSTVSLSAALADLEGVVVRLDVPPWM